MNKPTLNKILAKLPPESAQYAVRDMTFLTCSIFNDTHFISFKKFFGVPFSMLFWYGRPDGQICLYRPGPEYDRFAKNLRNLSATQLYSAVKSEFKLNIILKTIDLKMTLGMIKNSLTRPKQNERI